MNLEYAKQRLEAWGDWARESVRFSDLSYPHCSPEHKLFFGHAQRFEQDNPEAEEIDRIVRWMGDEARTIVTEYYIKGRSLVELESILKMSRGTIERRLEGVWGFVAGQLEFPRQRAG